VKKISFVKFNVQKFVIIYQVGFEYEIVLIEYNLEVEICPHKCSLALGDFFLSKNSFSNWKIID
jgi:hypothetical protein